MFKYFDLAADAEQVIYIVISVQQACFFIIVDVKFLKGAGSREGDSLFPEVDFDAGGRVFLNGGKNFLQEGITDGDG